MSQIKTEIPGIVRDTTNNALLNRDNGALSAYKKIKRKNLELEDMKDKVNNLDKKISDVESLLHKILEKIG